MVLVWIFHQYNYPLPMNRTILHHVIGPDYIIYILYEFCLKISIYGELSEYNFSATMLMQNFKPQMVLWIP